MTFLCKNIFVDDGDIRLVQTDLIGILIVLLLEAILSIFLVF